MDNNIITGIKVKSVVGSSGQPAVTQSKTSSTPNVISGIKVKGVTQDNSIQAQKQKRIEQGLPVSVRKDRVEPTRLGGLIRDLTKGPARLVANTLGQLGAAEETIGAFVNQDPERLRKADELGLQPAKSKYYGDLNKIGRTETGESMSLGDATKDLVGVGLETASFMPMGSAVSTPVKGFVKPGLQALKPTLRSIVDSGAGGLLSSTGTQLQETGKIDPIQTVMDTAVASAFGLGFGKLVDTAGFVRKWAQPSKWAQESIDNIINKEGSLEKALVNNPNLSKLLKDTDEFIDQLTTDDLKKKTFGRTEFGQEAKKQANLHIMTNLLSDLKTKYNGKVDPDIAYQANKDYLDAIAKTRTGIISRLSRLVPKSEITHYREIADEVFGSSYKKGDIPAAAQEAKAILMDILDRKAAANGIKTKRGKLSLQQMTSLIKETADVEFDEKLTTEQSRAVATLMRSFRKRVQDEVQAVADKSGVPELGEQYFILNKELFNALNAEKIIDNIRLNPVKASVFSNHMYGLLTGALTANPFLYTPGRLLAGFTADSLADLRLNNITQNPILFELGKRRGQRLSDALGDAFEKSKQKFTPEENFRRSTNEATEDFFTPGNKEKARQKESVNKVNKTKAKKESKKKTKLSDLVDKKKAEKEAKRQETEKARQSMNDSMNKEEIQTTKAKKKTTLSDKLKD